MAEPVNLPELPPIAIIDTHTPTGVRIYGYTKAHMREAKRAAYAKAVIDCAALIKKRWEDYDAECGCTDPETGTREHPGDGNEWVWDMQELEEAIRALISEKGEAS